jgi:hypothetical protein
MTNLVEALEAEARAQSDAAIKLLQKQEPGSTHAAAIQIGIANALYSIARRIRIDGLAGRGA